MRSLVLYCFFILPLSMPAQSHYPGQHAGKFALPDQLKPAVYSFDLKDVRLLNSRFKENMVREQQWLLQIDLKRLLHSFYVNAGMYDASEGGYDEIKKYAGWESLDCELRGHSTGHILSGLALMYAATGDPIYRAKGDTIITALAGIQKTLNQDGYVSAFPQEYINRNIRGEKVWAPWYTLHKILAGVIDQYLYCDNLQALAIAKGFATWAYKKLSPLTQQQRATMLRNEFGGINEVFYNLYAITGNNNDRWLGDCFYDSRMLDPLKSGIDNLQGTHANTYIPKLLGVTRAREIENINGQTDMATFFWKTVVDHHSFVTGSNSDREHFFKPDALAAHLTGYTGESCNVYNMLKLTRHLYIHSGAIDYMEYYEKALFNHILGQQDPKTGMVAYFLPMLPGAHKVYSTPDSSFWCCVGTGFENQAKYGESIYYHTENALYINLFIPSELNWKNKRLRLTQQTRFPGEGRMIFTVDEAPLSGMAIHIRYPLWATGGARVLVNGRPRKTEQTPGSYITVNRIWKKGDRIEVDYPMQLHLVPANDDPSVAAVVYGPVVLAGAMGSGNFSARAPYSDPTGHNDYYTYNYHVPATMDTSLVLDPASPDRGIKKIAGQPLLFKAPVQPVTLRPLYDIHGERYVVYWHIK